jgi:hypothetical protein
MVRMRWRRLLPALAGVPALALAGCAAPGAHLTALTITSPDMVVSATTQVSGHPDTTNASGGDCVSSSNGAVWAKDTYTSKMIAVETTSGTWHVTLEDNGSFAGFADPTTCSALTSSGSFSGDYTVTVDSSKTPSQASLGSSQPGADSTTQMVQHFFGDSSATVTGGDYFFVYQGGNYVQTSNSIYGDVTASAAILPPAGTPPNVTVTRTGPHTIHVTWGAEGGEGGGAATSYNFGVTPAPLNESSAMHNIGDVLSYNVGALQVGTTYTIEVQAQNSAGTGPIGMVKYHDAG